MKLQPLSLIALLAYKISAQNFGAEPSCAIPCLTSAISAAGCALTDQACQCGTGQAAIQTAVTPCLLRACSPSDLQSAASVGFGLCAVYSATATATGGGNFTIQTQTVTSAANGTGTGVLSTPSATSSASKSKTLTSTVTAVTTTAPSTSGTRTGTGTGTTSAVSVVSTAGAGSQGFAIGVGGVVGMLGALVAVL